MVVVEIAYGLDCVAKEQKDLAYKYFPDGAEVSLGNHPATYLKNPHNPEHNPMSYINIGVPRIIDVEYLTWKQGRRVTVQMEKETFDKLSQNIETHAKLSGKAFVPVPNYRETPPWLKGTADGSDAAKACVGWVYYADSSLWQQTVGIVPVVVIEPQRINRVVVVEIGTLPYIQEKQPASQYFKVGTGLTLGKANFVPLANEGIWINVAEPRRISINNLKWDPAKSTARMEETHFQYFADLAGKHFPKEPMSADFGDEDYDRLIKEGQRKAHHGEPMQLDRK